MRLIAIFGILFFGMTISAQVTVDDLKTQQADKKAQVATLQGEVDALQKQIDEFPGWKHGAFGVIGANLSQFDKWYSKDVVNSSAANIGITLNGFANLDREKFFWRNGGNLNLAWLKFDDKDNPTDNDDFQQATDVFNLSSLYGRKLSDKWALSALGEYRSTILSNFNNPGYLDLGVGATWTPIPNLVAVFHPINYNFVFADDNDIFQSSLGCKVLVDYTRQLPRGISWKSNLTGFLSYEDTENLTNWTWVNTLAFKVWKGIGVGVDFGLRNNKQESLNYEKNVKNVADATFDNIDNDLQTYWLIGLSYGF